MRAVAAIAHLETGDLDTAQGFLSGDDRLILHPGADQLVDPAASVEKGSITEQVLAPTLPVDSLLTLGRRYVQRLTGQSDGASDDRPREAEGDAWSPHLNLRQLQVLTLMHWGLDLVSLGMASQAGAALAAARVQADRLGHGYAVMTCLTGSTAAAAVTGDVFATRALARQAVTTAELHGQQTALRLLFPYVVLADEAYERLELQRANALLRSAQSVVSGWERRQSSLPLEAKVGSPGFDVSPQVRRSLALTATNLQFEAAQGDPLQQQRLVSARAEALNDAAAPSSGSMMLRLVELTTHHRLALMTGQLELAQRAEQLALPLPVMEGDLLVMQALHALRLNREVDARSLVRPVLRGEVMPVMLTSRVSAILIEATVAIRSGQHAHAHELLLQAVDLAAARKVYRMLLHVSPEILPALRAAQGRLGRSEEFVRDLLRAVEESDLPVDRPRVHQSAGAGSAPLLSPRELSLLRDLPSLLTVSEIAQARSVSVNTVKTQLRSLYEKLGVQTRRDAVAVGRVEGLV